MMFTWFVAANLWMSREDHPDPFRMAQEKTAEILNLPLPQLPKDKDALVA